MEAAGGLRTELLVYFYMTKEDSELETSEKMTRVRVRHTYRDQGSFQNVEISMNLSGQLLASLSELELAISFYFKFVRTSETAILGALD